jgi:hypothetical protein
VVTNILLDQNHVTKIGSYNIPILAEAMMFEQGGAGNMFQIDRYVVKMAVLHYRPVGFHSFN